MQKQSKSLFSSKRARLRFTLFLILIFAIVSFLGSAGNYYNRFSSTLAKATHNVVILPPTKEIPFVLGLDLQGGTQLTYEANVNNIPEADRASSLEGVRDVIERRVNSTGVSEPVIQVNRSISGDYRVIVELAGIKNVNDAIKMIGETPLLEFKETTVVPADNIKITTPTITSSGTSSVAAIVATSTVPEAQLAWKNTELTGKNLKSATLKFNPNDGTPEVALKFDTEGSKMFEDITGRNVNKQVAIVLDGYTISAPTVSQKISGGEAVISGKFTVTEAKLLVQRLNTGALPVPINLIGQQTVEASLGQQSIDNSFKAGIVGFLLVALFMILYYRFPGLISVVCLGIYVLAVLAIFKIMPWWMTVVFLLSLFTLFLSVFRELKIFDGFLSVAMFLIVFVFLGYYAHASVTLTLAGITGFILSIGMAVDANILIFERMKEELLNGKPLDIAIDEGFKRAWPSIRDGNTTTILACFVLMSFGTGLVKGFGATLFLGVSISMLSSIVITSSLMRIFVGKFLARHPWWLGVKKINN
ncbi:MAG: preprotein translocase subunit SecD [Candidatus Falkowbacteria bacterium]